ncbi:MAG TPA: TolC family protein [Thermoanaerobaculia bacterium]|nr:TolC family protein [Thermoanaerobaculia bacterium]
MHNSSGSCSPAAPVVLAVLTALSATPAPRLAAQAAAGAAPGIALGSLATPRPVAPTPSAIVKGTESPFQGSVPSGEATAEVLQLTLAGALERGLRTNLGMIERGLDARVAESERRRALSSLLPRLEGSVRHWTGELDLVTFGFQFPGVPQVIGPFSYQDARLSLTQQLLNLQSLRGYQSARQAERAAQLSLADARDTVLVAVGGAYYQVVASAARVDTARAQLKSSQALDELAANQVRNGLAPAIDSFRATVERQTGEQRVAVAEAALEKDKLTLGRLIGLPPGQRFAITTPVGYEPWSGPGQEQALATAAASRSDLKSAEAAVQSAELARQAAQAERLPSLELNADYGRVGKNLVKTDGTFTVAAGLAVPVFTGGRIGAAVARAEAVLERRRSVYADLTARVDYEVRSSFLDLEAAQTSVEVARKNIELADKTLAQAQDRFANGVTNNVEAVLAEQELAAAHENYIASLFSHNFAKLALLRAMGILERGVKQYLGGVATSGKE